MWFQLAPVRSTKPAFPSLNRPQIAESRWRVTQERPDGASGYSLISKALQALATCQDDATAQHLLNVTELQADGTDVWVIKRGKHGSDIPIHSSETLAQTYL